MIRTRKTKDDSGNGLKSGGGQDPDGSKARMIETSLAHVESIKSSLQNSNSIDHLSTNPTVEVACNSDRNPAISQEDVDFEFDSGH